MDLNLIRAYCTKDLKGKLRPRYKWYLTPESRFEELQILIDLKHRTGAENLEPRQYAAAVCLRAVELLGVPFQADDEHPEFTSTICSQSDRARLADALQSYILHLSESEAAPLRPAAPAQPADTVSAPAEVNKPVKTTSITNWRHKVQAEAWEHWLRLRASGCNPSVHSICDHMASWCVDQNIRGGKNQNPRAGTIRNTVLGGSHWTPPNYSVADAKKYIAQIAQTAQMKVAQIEK